MSDSQNTFVQTLRERLSAMIEPDAVENHGILVEEHAFEELDDKTQTAVTNLFDTLRLRKEQLKDPDAFGSVRVKTLGQL